MQDTSFPFHVSFVSVSPFCVRPLGSEPAPMSQAQKARCHRALSRSVEAASLPWNRWHWWLLSPVLLRSGCEVTSLQLSLWFTSSQTSNSRCKTLRTEPDLVAAYFAFMFLAVGWASMCSKQWANQVAGRNGALIWISKVYTIKSLYQTNCNRGLSDHERHWMSTKCLRNLLGFGVRAWWKWWNGKRKWNFVQREIIASG